jgi:hypothetical protein
MRFPRLTLLLAFTGAATVGACFANQVAPSTFRNACDQNEDCRSDEACIVGLCQLPCAQDTFADDCPSADGYVACINGACGSLCSVPEEDGADPCSAPLECLDVGVDLSGGGFGGGASPTDAVGVCVAKCSTGSCESGERCVEGFCTATCAADAECATDFICLLGICVPDVPETSGGDTSTGGAGQ